MVQRITIVVLLFVTFFFSCKKEKSIDTPVAQITSPVSGTIFHVFDTIYITGHVSDPDGLTVVSLYITNSQNQQVLSAVNPSITSNSMGISCGFPINDIHLTSGTYTIVLYAYNGTNSAYAFQQISIIAAPVKREAVYAITRSSSGVSAWKVDTSGNVTLNYTRPGDYSSSDVSNYYQQLIIAGADSGNVNSNAVPTGSAGWSLPGFITSALYFTNVYDYTDEVYVSYYNGFVKYYNSVGVLQASYVITPTYYPIKTFVWQGYLFIEEKNIGSSGRNLVVFNNSTTAGVQLTSLPGPVIAMFGMDNDHIFVFGNNNSGTPYLMQYSISGNLFYSPAVLPTASMLSADQVDASDYVIGFADGTIYKYSYSPYGMVSFITGVVASHIRYDNVYNHIVVATGHYVKEYDYLTGSLSGTATIADSVLNIHILNNH